MRPGIGRIVAYVVPAEACAAPVRRLAALEAVGALADHARYELPNGLAIVHLNRTETEFSYQEIFEDEVYLQHGITLRAGDCVFDVGANIGLFTLFASTRCPGLRVYAFEPIPAVVAALRVNTAINNPEVRVFACGLGATGGEQEFSFYRHTCPVLSGMYAVRAQEQRTLEAYRAVTEGPVAPALMAEMLGARLESERDLCPVRTLEEVMATECIGRIDLLKIDV